MIKKTLLIISLLFLKMFFCQNTDPVYYDQDWKVTSKAKASYYRVMPMKEIGELVLIQDFYINGTPQFEGYAFKKDENAYVGDIVWYDEYGNDNNFRQYRNDTKNLTLLYYHPNGKIRKKVQYKNGVKEGEALIYGTDGAILMKGTYTKGKPTSGSFEKVKNSHDYDYNSKSDDDNDKPKVLTEAVVLPSSPALAQAVEVSPQIVEVVAPAEIPIEEISSNKSKNRKTVSEKIFWKDSKQLAQEIVYEISSYSFKPIVQKNCDRSGKLIQSLQENHFEKYGNGIANGTEYAYYLQNNFANGLKSVSVFANGDKSGKETAYFPNGKIASETNFKNGLKEGEEIIFNEDETLKSKRTYIENEPFNGNFDEQINDAFVSLNYVKGLKEGEAIAKNENRDVIAKGIYKNGKPFNGTFIEEKQRMSGDFELINVENFKQTGLQKVFSYSLYNLDKTYTIQNEKLNGVTTFYNDGKIAGTLEYKNDEPYNGTLVDNDKNSVYKNGKLIEEIFFENHYNKDNIKKQKFYENGILVKVKDYSFSITEKPQEFYEGIFKNGKPFSGYFETDYSREFKQVDYFENGIPKFQYSNDYLKNMDNYTHQNYNIKSTYKDGKIFDGAEYILNEKQFTIKYWKNGVLKSFDWDLFAMHYFNRLHFELKSNAIEVSDMQANRKAEIKIGQSQNTFNKQLSIDGKVIDDTRKDYLESKYKEGIIAYHEKEGKIISTAINPMDESMEATEGTELFYKVYMMVKESASLQENFNSLAEKISGNKFIEETDENNIITGIQLDAEGKPKDGILITPTQNDTYTLQLYMNRKLIKTVENVSYNKVKEEARKLERID